MVSWQILREQALIHKRDVMIVGAIVAILLLAGLIGDMPPEVELDPWRSGHRPDGGGHIDAASRPPDNGIGSDKNDHQGLNDVDQINGHPDAQLHQTGATFYPWGE